MGDGEQVDELGEPVVGRRPERPERDGAAEQGPHLGDALLGLVCGRDHAPRVDDELLAGLGQPDPTAEPDKEVDLEVALELPDLLRDRRLRHLHAGRDGREGPELGGAEEVQELTKSQRYSFGFGKEGKASSVVVPVQDWPTPALAGPLPTPWTGSSMPPDLRTVVAAGSHNAAIGMPAAWEILAAGGSALDAVEAATRVVEDNEQDHSVGYALAIRTCWARSSWTQRSWTGRPGGWARSVRSKATGTRSPSRVA